MFKSGDTFDLRCLFNPVWGPQNYSEGSTSLISQFKKFVTEMYVKYQADIGNA